MLLTRPPRKRPEGDPVRLACIRHAASVDPEPGSNSPPSSQPDALPGIDQVSHSCVAVRTSPRRCGPLRPRRHPGLPRTTRRSRGSGTRELVKVRESAGSRSRTGGAALRSGGTSGNRGRIHSGSFRIRSSMTNLCRQRPCLSEQSAIRFVSQPANDSRSPQTCQATFSRRLRTHMQRALATEVLDNNANDSK